VATGTGQRRLGVVHRRTRTPGSIVGRTGVAVVARSTARRRDVRAGREIRRAQYRGAVLVAAVVAGRATAGRRRVVGVVFASSPCRRAHAGNRRRQCGGVTDIAGPAIRDVAVAAPQRSVGRRDTTVMTSRALPCIGGRMGMPSSQPCRCTVTVATQCVCKT
jgi:hypothetical protein